MNHKLILAIGLVSLAVIFYILNAEGDSKGNVSAENSIESSQTVSVPNTQERLASEPKKTETSADISLTDIQNLPLYETNCGPERDLFFGSINNANTAEYSEVQLQQLEKFVDKCSAWFNLKDSLSEEEKSELTASLEKYDKAYKSVIVFEHDPDTLRNARFELANPTHPSISEMALYYLLNFDQGFSDLVNERLGISVNNTAFLRTYADAIAGIHGCELGKDCSKEGLFMSGLCLSRKEACNRSYYTYLQQIYTDNVYAEIFTVHNVVKQIIQSEDFM